MGFCCSRQNTDALPTIKWSPKPSKETTHEQDPVQVVLEQVSPLPATVDVVLETLLGDRVSADKVERSLAQVQKVAREKFITRYREFLLFCEGRVLSDKQVAEKGAQGQRLLLTIIPRPAYDFGLRC